MACKVFGTPITEETLEGMTKYHDRFVTKLNKASVAFEMKNAEGKEVNAHKYFDDIRTGHNDDGIKAVIYNATGGTVKLVYYYHADGCMGPSPIPMVIANGQWGVYFHPVDVNSTQTARHVLVYAGRNARGVEHQWVYVVEANYRGNKCYTEIRPAGYYPLSGKDNYDGNKYYDEASGEGCTSFVSIGGDALNVFVEGIMTLEDAFGW